jgi:hypothetical protein
MNFQIDHKNCETFEETAELFHPVPENYCAWDEFIPWPEYDTSPFKDNIYDNDVDSSWSEFDASEHELFPIEIHYINMNVAFTELLHRILEHLEKLDENVLMVNKLFYSEGKKIKKKRDEENFINIKRFLSTSPFFKSRS